MDRATLIKLKTMSTLLKERYGAEQVILYGSYASGMETEDSDIDLLVVASTDENILDRMATVRHLIRDVKKGMAISPLVFTPEEFETRKKMGDPFILSILEEGLAV